MPTPQKNNARKSWPGVAIPAARIFSVMGCDSDRIFECPSCDRHVGQFTNDFDRGGVVARCNSCGWFGDPFKFFMDTNEIDDIGTAITAIRAAKVTVPKACERPSTIRSYQKYLESRKTLRAFYTAMEKRYVAHIGGQPIMSLGVPMRPHAHSEWWCTTLAELRLELGNTVVSADGHGWSDAKRVAQAEEQPVVVIPRYDCHYQVVGLTVLGENDWVNYTGHGCPTGVGLSGVSGRYHPPSWAGKWLVVGDVTAAVAMTSAAKRDNGMLYPLSLVCDDSADTRQTIGYEQRTGVVVWCPGSELRPQMIRLARKIKAPIATAMMIGESFTEPVRWVAQNVIGLTVSWIEALEDAMIRRSDFSARDLLSGVGWGPRTAEKAKQAWRPASYERALTLMNTISWRDIRITPDLIVCDAEDGLVNTFDNDVLYAAVPVIKKVYRGDDGKTRYAGFVKHLGREYAFDSAAFSRDPVAVIDALLLRNNVSPPIPHPAIVPHLVSVARYMGGA